MFLDVASLDRLPVVLLTGFLGSGKTTLLNGLLRHPSLSRTAVLINEFGDIPLDHHFVEHSDGEVVVMANGCLCCSVNGDLEGVIGTLFARRARGGAGGFDRMLIETTGLADPGPILQVLLAKPLIAENFRVDGVVATVDALHGRRQIAEHSEAVEQIALADRLVITKTDVAPPEGIARLEQVLADLNDRALRLRVIGGDVDPATLFGAGLDDAAPGPAQALRWLGDPAPPPQPDSSDRAPEQSHLHRADVESFTLTADHPLEWRPFWDWLTGVRVRHAAQLLRVKGILEVRGETHPVAVHGVHHVFHPPARLALEHSPWPGARIVFIVRGPVRTAIEEGWRSLTRQLNQ
jgi:G3E family GTPase